MNTGNNPKKSRRGSGLLILLALFALAIFLGLLAWNSPLLGRRLPSADSTLFPTGPVKGPPPEGSIEAGAPAITSSPSGGALCGGPDQMLLLALGIDENAQADVIRLVRLDFLVQEVRVLSIPRDFLVQIPGFEQHGITQGRISAAYGYGEYYQGEGKGNGVIALANTIFSNYGVQFDRYVVVNIQSAARWVDQLGGVDIFLEQPVEGKDGTRFFEAGEHHFDGEEALEFFLIRQPDSDIERSIRQTLLLKALYAKAVTTLSLAELTDLGLEIATDRGTLTDLSASDIYALACLAKNLTDEDIHFAGVPAEMYHSATTELGGSVLVPGPEVAPFIQDMMGIN